MGMHNTNAGMAAETCSFETESYKCSGAYIEWLLRMPASTLSLYFIFPSQSCSPVRQVSLSSIVLFPYSPLHAYINNWELGEALFF